MPARPDTRREIATQQSLTADGEGLGVRSGPAIRNLDAMLQAEVFSQNATVAGLQTRQTALQAIDAVQGTPGQGDDIASLLGKLQDQFSTLLNDPGSAAAAEPGGVRRHDAGAGHQRAERRLHHAAPDGGGQHRRRARDAEHDTRHHRRAQQQDRHAEGSGQSTADLENQRDAALADLSQLVDVKALEQPNGDLLVATTAA